jgi:gentisate 1,2-dioxygenase
VYPKLFEASDIINLEDGAERRSLRLCTPNMPWPATTPTINAAVQMVLPGEVARAHRHSAAAFRFVIEGDGGGYTTVNGESCPMESSDLILTPQTCWHDHGSRSDKPVIWLDILDFPFVRLLNAIFYEAYNDKSQEVMHPDGHGRRMTGPARPAGTTSPRTGLPYHYKGADTLTTLREMPNDAADPFDGVTIEYLNPITGGPTLPTTQCRLHRLVAGMHTRRHRHTWNVIYHVVEGYGKTMVGDKTLAWEPHDTFSLPAWWWHEHLCTGNQDAVVFSVTDEPIFRAFALDRVEEVA